MTTSERRSIPSSRDAIIPGGLVRDRMREDVYVEDRGSSGPLGVGSVPPAFRCCFSSPSSRSASASSDLSHAILNSSCCSRFLAAVRDPEMIVAFTGDRLNSGKSDKNVRIHNSCRSLVDRWSDFDSCGSSGGFPGGGGVFIVSGSRVLPTQILTRPASGMQDSHDGLPLSWTSNGVD